MTSCLGSGKCRACAYMVDVAAASLVCLIVRGGAGRTMTRCRCRSAQARWGAEEKAGVGVQHGSVEAVPSPGMRPRFPRWVEWLVWCVPLTILSESLQQCNAHSHVCCATACAAAAHNFCIIHTCTRCANGGRVACTLCCATCRDQYLIDFADMSDVI